MKTEQAISGTSAVTYKVMGPHYKASLWQVAKIGMEHSRRLPNLTYVFRDPLWVCWPFNPGSFQRGPNTAT